MSSQHFSTTFKKLTGYTPSEFRKNKTPDHQLYVMNCIIIIEMGTDAVKVFAFDLSGNLISLVEGALSYLS
ncbi:AraC family transcriptional regulator [Mucilaginibacter sp. P19]|uniref:AraC family transcriptional regulator n=1 Tax=Mucilaginibacter sp. P19 TaxID=3423947 RepID=UPI003D67F646